MRGWGRMLSLALLVGCGSAGSSSDEAEDGRVAPAEACDAYLSCAAEQTPAAIGALLDTYGTDGTCWSSAEEAALCETACEVGLEQLRVMDDVFDGDSACWADAGPLRPGRYEAGVYCRDELTFSSDFWVSEVDAEGFVLSDGMELQTECAFDGSEFVCASGATGTVESGTSWSQTFDEDDWFCDDMRVEAEWVDVD